MPEQTPQITPMLEIALDLAERGFRVIPLGDPWSALPRNLIADHAGDEDAARYAFCKRARIKWQEFQQRDPTDDEIRSWWGQWPQANVGIVTGVSVNVLDGDTAEAVEFLDSGNITRTPWRVKTPKGMHFYFRLSPSLAIRNSAANGLDARGLGGYVVGPGSTSGSGMRYEWSVDMAWGADSIGDLPMLTADDISKVFAWRGRSQPANETGDPQGDVLGNLASVKSGVDSSTIALPGARNNELARQVGAWLQKGYSLEEVLAAAKIWNHRLPAPLSDAEVVHTVTSIVMTHQRKNDVSVPLERKKLPIPVHTLGELDSSPPEKPESFWRDSVMFRECRIIVSGEPKVGKSMFAIGLGMAASTGGEFLGHKFDKPLKFLWLQAEIHMGFVHDRLGKFTDVMNSDVLDLAKKNFIASGRCDLDLMSDAQMDDLIEIMDAIKPDIVCFDPVINFSSAKENDNSDVRQLLRRIDYIGGRFKCATILIHHVGKSDRAKTMNDIRGASAFRGWFDTGIMLSGSSSNIVCSYELRNSEGINAHGLQFDNDSGQFTVTDLTDETTHGHTDIAWGAPRSAKEPKTKPDDQLAHERNLNKLISMVLSSPQGIGYAQLIQTAVKLNRPNLSKRSAERLVSELSKIKLIEKKTEGRNTFYYPKTGGEND